MPRKILLSSGGHSTLLTENEAENEHELQELVKSHPDLLPISEFGLQGPLLVIGRETSLPSGAIDLVGLARGGEILLAEFKTGPKNTDFRRSIAQLLDYGSDLWGLPYNEFEQTVPLSYFRSDYCTENRFKSADSLEEACATVWPDLDEEGWASILDSVEGRLASGGFHYVVAAQRFVSSVLRTMEYLNAVVPAASFFAVEIVAFTGEDATAHESRTLLRPSRRPPVNDKIGPQEILDAVEDDTYRSALQDVFEAARGQSLIFFKGRAGLSIRVPVEGQGNPISIAWAFPPGVPGWMGLKDLSLGYGGSSELLGAEFKDVLEAYFERAKALNGAEVKSEKDDFKVVGLRPHAVVSNRDAIIDLMTQVVSSIRQTTIS